MILAIDPGPRMSAWVLYEPGSDHIYAFGKDPNEDVLALPYLGRPDVSVVIEQIQPRYGMQVGWETLDTARWTGRFQQAALGPVFRIQRSQVLDHFGIARVARKGEKKMTADAGIRAAIIDRYGGSKAAAVGLKATPGPLYGVKRDVWAAISVAIAFAENPGLAE